MLNLKKSVYLQLGIYVYSEYFTIHIYNNQTLKTMFKKNVKLILVMSAMILAGQDATAQLINRWIIPGFKDTGHLPFVFHII